MKPAALVCKTVPLPSLVYHVGKPTYIGEDPDHAPQAKSIGTIFVP